VKQLIYSLVLLAAAGVFVASVATAENEDAAKSPQPTVELTKDKACDRLANCCQRYGPSNTQCCAAWLEFCSPPQ
jgi:hypothetical protein